MTNKEENLSALSQMIQLAKSDNDFNEIEYNFIVAVAGQLGVSVEEVDSLLKRDIKQEPLQTESQRILQFHRLVLVLNVDQEVKPKELQTIREIGVFMGLRPEAIDTVLKEMYKYPNNVIPPDKLIAIFTRFYN